MIINKEKLLFHFLLSTVVAVMTLSFTAVLVHIPNNQSINQSNIDVRNLSIDLYVLHELLQNCVFLGTTNNIMLITKSKLTLKCNSTSYF